MTPIEVLSKQFLSFLTKHQNLFLGHAQDHHSKSLCVCWQDLLKLAVR